MSASPGASNNGTKSVKKDKIVPTIEFSKSGGFYDEPISVELSAREMADGFNESIYYTTDGSEPTSTSNHYSEPILIDKTTVLKAKVIKKDYLTNLSVASSYIFPQRKLSLPVVSLSLNPDYLWDDMIGIYTDGKNGAYYYKQDRYVNWAQDWRRPVNVEYFIDGKTVINQIGEMRLMGGYSREKPQKSLAVYANKRFGTKRYNYKFFKEKESKDEGYKSFILRNSGQDFNRSLMRDAVNHYLIAGKIDMDYQAYQPAIVFLNGEYWGIHNVRERSNDHHIIANYGTEDIDMLEDFTLKNGTSDNYNEFYSLVKRGNMTYDELEKYLDIEENLNYFILETFISNKDWPHNNVVLWRKRDNGKWRWLLKDTDYSTDFANTVWFNALEYIQKGTKPLNNIMKVCLDNEQFRDQFIDRYTVYLGDIFKKETTVQLVDSFANQISEEMVYARQRWDLSYEAWEKNIISMKNWMRSRPDYVYGHLQKRFSLGKPVPVTIDKLSGENVQLRINDIPLSENSFKGKFFSGREMSIALNESEESKFKYWVIEKNYAEEKTVQLLSDKVFGMNLDSTIVSVQVKAVYDELMPIVDFDKGVLTVQSDIDDSNIGALSQLMETFAEPILAINLENIKYTSDIPLDSLFEIASPNRLIYTKQELEGKNVVCKNFASEIVLSTEYPFYCPISFEAEKVRVIRNRYNNDNHYGYYPLILPFGLNEEELEGKEVLTLSEDVFTLISETKPNIPYFYCNRAEGSDRVILFDAQNKTIHATPEIMEVKGTSMSLKGNYLFAGKEIGYFINSTIEPGYKPGRLLVHKECDITPFTVYMVDQSGKLPEKFQVGIGLVDNEKLNNEPSLRIIPVQNGVLLRSLKQIDVPIYTMDGRLLNIVSIKDNELRVELSEGLYMIGKQKVKIGK